MSTARVQLPATSADGSGGAHVSSDADGSLHLVSVEVQRYSRQELEQLVSTDFKAFTRLACGHCGKGGACRRFKDNGPLVVQGMLDVFWCGECGRLLCEEHRHDHTCERHDARKEQLATMAPEVLRARIEEERRLSEAARLAAKAPDMAATAASDERRRRRSTVAEKASMVAEFTQLLAREGGQPGAEQDELLALYQTACRLRAFLAREADSPTLPGIAEKEWGELKAVYLRLCELTRVHLAVPRNGDWEEPDEWVEIDMRNYWEEGHGSPSELTMVGQTIGEARAAGRALARQAGAPEALLAPGQQRPADPAAAVAEPPAEPAGGWRAAGPPAPAGGGGGPTQRRLLPLRAGPPQPLPAAAALQRRPGDARPAWVPPRGAHEGALGRGGQRGGAASTSLVDRALRPAGPGGASGRFQVSLQARGPGLARGGPLHVAGRQPPAVAAGHQAPAGGAGPGGYPAAPSAPSARAAGSVGVARAEAPPAGGCLAVEEDEFWIVVGGVDSGGIVARVGAALSSAELQRLATGAIVRGLAVKGDRLRFEKVSGGGPQEGWVSIRVKGKELLQHTTANME